MSTDAGIQLSNAQRPSHSIPEIAIMKRTLLVSLLFFPFLFGGTVSAQEGKTPKAALAKDKPSPSGWLGVSMQDMTPRLARDMEVKTKQGALVNDVVEDSPAEKAGMKEEDIIIEFGGKRIEDADALVQAVRGTTPGTTVNATVVRNDAEKALAVTVGKLPRRQRTHFNVFVPPMPPRIPHIRMGQQSSLYGLSVMDLTGQLGEYFQAPGGKGVLVEEVEKESPAATAGFTAGDVIVKAGKKEVKDTRDFWQAVDDRSEGEKVECDVIRKGSRTSVTLTVPEDDQEGQFRFERHEFDRDMENLRHEMRSLRERIREDLPAPPVRRLHQDHIGGWCPEGVGGVFPQGRCIVPAPPCASL
jgi:serine protease Do